jgi:hypothetical protein
MRFLSNLHLFPLLTSFRTGLHGNKFPGKVLLPRILYSVKPHQHSTSRLPPQIVRFVVQAVGDRHTISGEQTARNHVDSLISKVNDPTVQASVLLTS